jgi:hypothetical protein
VRLSITIDKAKFPVAKMPLAPVMPILNPSMSGDFKIQDMTSGAVLCEGASSTASVSCRTCATPRSATRSRC